MRLTNNKGFTLIEIVVVLIILGVLTTIALPSYFSWIARSTAAEGIVNMGITKNNLLACKAKGATDIQQCFTDNDGLPTSYTERQSIGNFTYIIRKGFSWCTPSCWADAVCTDISCTSFTGNDFLLGWTMRRVDGIVSPGQTIPSSSKNDIITLSGNGDNSKIICWGIGKYAGVC